MFVDGRDTVTGVRNKWSTKIVVKEEPRDEPQVGPENPSSVGPSLNR